MVPAAPPSSAGSAAAVARTRSEASSTEPSHPAAFSPKVVGTACWARVRAAIGVARCSWASAASAAAIRDRSRSMPARVRTVSSIAAESRMSWLVLPRCTCSAAEGSTAATAAVSSWTSTTTGLAAPRARSARSTTSIRADRTPSATASAEAAGITPSDAWARARATSASSIAATHASSLSSASASVPAHTGASNPASVPAAARRRSFCSLTSAVLFSALDTLDVFQAQDGHTRAGQARGRPTGTGSATGTPVVRAPVGLLSWRTTSQFSLAGTDVSEMSAPPDSRAVRRNRSSSTRRRDSTAISEPAGPCHASYTIHPDGALGVPGLDRRVRGPVRLLRLRQRTPRRGGRPAGFDRWASRLFRAPG